jgi:S-adenosylmethionine hydrolase
MSPPLFALFTDYGLGGPWVGQLHALIRRTCPSAGIIDLQHDLPAFRPHAAGLLLARMLAHLPDGAWVLAVVDPGVGSERRGLVLELNGRVLVGPDNGLFAPLLARAQRIRFIDEAPPTASDTFHGRDWFGPVLVRLARGESVALIEAAAGECVGHDWPGSLAEIIYVDHFGNLVTGIPAGGLDTDQVLHIAGYVLRHARTFADVPRGEAFWHANALGLLELSVNQGSAAELLGLRVGDPLPCVI